MRRLILVALALIVLALVAGWYRYGRSVPPPAIADAAEHFKYGSIGAEVDGLPYPIWRALPHLCADALPGGYAQFGFITEPGRDLPVGVSVRRYRIDRVGFNCAACHTAAIDGGPPLLGAPAAQVDLAAYARFVLQCGTRASFTPAGVLAAMDASGVRLNPIDRAVYRFIVIPKARTVFAERRRSLEWMDGRPLHGPGRTDAFNPWRQRFGLNPAGDRLLATVDFPSVWNQEVRDGMWLHWDADNNSLAERNLSAALAGGASEASLDHPSIDRVTSWLRSLRPPAFPGPIDGTMAAAGRAVYQREACGTCHDVGGPRTGQSTPLAEIGTDPARTQAFTPALLPYMLSIGTGYPWRFSHYRVPDGYANSPLDGIWARAPYLHNGSVPTLEDLLSPADDRPRAFGRGCRTFDLVKVGYRCDGPFRFEVSEPGNGNGGHLYGTRLSPADRRALIEYLKTQ